MPVYEFLCETCGPIEQRVNYGEARDSAICPRCQSTAKRVYSIPGILKDAATRHREEQQSQPRLVTRPHLEPPVQAPKWRQPGGRPWLIGH